MNSKNFKERLIRLICEFKRHVSNNQGFNLVELMFAVIIAGTLAAVSIPQYQKFAARSRQGEAKIALSALYSSQKTYALEFGTYTACYQKLGFKPETNRYYALGFNSNYSTPNTCGIAGNESCLGFLWNSTGAIETGGSCNSSETGWDANLTAGGDNPGPPTIGNLNSAGGADEISRDRFIARAAGKISPSQSRFDRWYIDENKNLVNDESGV